jgi:DNA-binding NarL/FixJ family response regulator
MNIVVEQSSPAFVAVPRSACESCGRARDTTVSDRELEVLALVASDYQDKEVAAALGLEWRTIRSHMTHIRDKIGARSRLGAVMVALEAGWIRRVDPSAEG